MENFKFKCDLCHEVICLNEQTYWDIFKKKIINNFYLVENLGYHYEDDDGYRVYNLCPDCRDALSKVIRSRLVLREF